MISTLLKDLLNVKEGDPSVFMGIGRMVDALLGDEDDTTISSLVYARKRRQLVSRSSKVQEPIPVVPDSDWLDDIVAKAPGSADEDVREYYEDSIDTYPSSTKSSRRAHPKAMRKLPTIQEELEPIL